MRVPICFIVMIASYSCSKLQCFVINHDTIVLILNFKERVMDQRAISRNFFYRKSQFHCLRNNSVLLALYIFGKPYYYTFRMFCHRIFPFTLKAGFPLACKHLTDDQAKTCLIFKAKNHPNVDLKLYDCYISLNRQKTEFSG